MYLGAVAIGFDPNRWDSVNRWDPVIVGLPRGGHGIHVTDVVGITLITIGVVLLWRSPRPQA